MDFFVEYETEEDFEEFKQIQLDDDEKFKETIASYDHQQLQFALINTGTMLNIISQFFKFEESTIKDINNDKGSTRTRKVNKILDDLNNKINLRYDFSEDTEVIPSFCFYNDEYYLVIDKTLFLKKIMRKFNKQ